MPMSTKALRVTPVQLGRLSLHSRTIDLPETLRHHREAFQLVEAAGQALRRRRANPIESCYLISLKPSPAIAAEVSLPIL